MATPRAFKNHQRFDFPIEGMMFIVHTDVDDIRVEVRRAKWLDGMGKTTFKPRRLLADFEILNLSGEPYELDLILYYTQADEDFAKRDGEELDFAVWLDNDWKSLRSTYGDQISFIEIDPPYFWDNYSEGYIGYAHITGFRLDDPTISVGK